MYDGRYQDHREEFALQYLKEQSAPVKVAEQVQTYVGLPEHSP
jgi:hypothetical protein